jgi:chromosome segregation protein
MLKYLELFGFKSFADRTRFDFPAGITCVVGPNGSGKSNVVDAMKWILGDQSPKSLRGKDMQDVIFNGSSGRKASAFAEAILTFDNTQRFLPYEVDEVTIGRRLWMTGESEYLINGAQSRLKDVRDAFVGTGAATSAYSIIEQGKVEQILQANAAARRLVFEEAAGISRFKSRKTEALRKIERVSQNLVRLTDIVDQLESQLNSTRSQAAKAAKYREVSKELKSLWIGLAADDYRHLSATLRVLERELAESQAEVDELNEKQSQIEERLASFDSELSDVDDRLRDSERGSSTSREQIVSQEATIRHESSSAREMDGDLDRLRHQQATMAGRLREVILELAESQEELDQFEETWQTQQRHVEEQTRQLEAGDAAAAAAKSQLDAREQTRTRLAERLASAQQQTALLEAQLESLKESTETLTLQWDELSVEIEEAQLELNRRQARVNDVLGKSQSASESFQRIRSQQRELLTRQDETKQSLSELRERRSDRKARLAVLEDLESRQEGLGLGVREILNRARTSDQKPWNQILGSVADLLDVELENAALLEVALGSRAQLIVLEEIDALIEYLTSGTVRIDGRVGFLSVQGPFAGAASQKPEIDLAMDPEVVCRADSLVSSECQYLSLARQLLGETWVVMDLESARRLASTCPNKRFVTLQGELFEPDGTLFTGTIRGETAVLSRKNELRRLRVELTRLDQQVAASESQLKHTNAQLQEMEAELTDVTAERDEITSRLSQVKSKYDAQHQICERLVLDRTNVDGQLKANSEKAVGVRSRLDEHQWESSRIEAEQRSLDEALTELREQLIQFDATRDELLQAQTDQKLKLTRHEERRSTLQSTCRRLDEEARQRRENLEESQRRFQTVHRKRRASNLRLLNVRSRLASLAILQDESERAVRDLVVERDRLRGVRGKLVEEDTSIRQQRRLIADQRHDQELKVREIRHQLTTAGSRIEEEYGIALKVAVADGESAFLVYLVDRGILVDEDAEETLAEETPTEESSWSEEDSSEEAAAELDEEHEDWEDDSEEASLQDDDEEAVASDAASSQDRVTLGEFDGIRFTDVRDELEEQVNRLRRKLKMMGSVNTDSLNDLDDLEPRYEHFHSQLMDLTEARTTLEDIIRRINSESRRMFLDSFESVRKEFRELFRKLFGGGEGDIILEDPDDVLDCGIDIVARPPGKELRSISLLSGGEKTMTAVALLLAIFRSSPSPFCILDEVDAALDDANVERYAAVIREFRDFTQFIIITHRKRTMVAGDVIYGVTMEQSGVSKRMSIRFEEVGENGEFDGAAASDEDTGSAQAA